MLADAQLRNLLKYGEADHVERTQGVNDRTKYAEAICSFANDLPDRRETSVLFIGVRDDGSCAGVSIQEQLLQMLMALRTDGNILPPPVMHVRRHILDGCEMAIVEVQPSDNPPVKFDGRVCIRIGPRRGYATAEEERRLVEKRRWGALTFDQQPIPGVAIEDLDLLRFKEEVLPALVHPDVIAENRRTVEEQMRALGVLGPEAQPTAMGLLVCGKDPRAWLPGAYVQFVRYPGTTLGNEIQDQKEIGGPLAQMFRQLDEIFTANNQQQAGLTGATQENKTTFPAIAIQELVRNAVIHRNYENTGAPVMLTWYADRMEITSPGGPYGAVTIETFGQPGLSDSRNPSLSTVAKAMGFVQKFGSGIPRAQKSLEANGNPPAEFRVEPNFVNVTIRARP